jgi:hypothetical protein
VRNSDSSAAQLRPDKAGDGNASNSTWRNYRRLVRPVLKDFFLAPRANRSVRLRRLIDSASNGRPMNEGCCFTREAGTSDTPRYAASSSVFFLTD